MSGKRPLGKSVVSDYDYMSAMLANQKQQVQQPVGTIQPQQHQVAPSSAVNQTQVPQQTSTSQPSQLNSSQNLGSKPVQASSTLPPPQPSTSFASKGSRTVVPAASNQQPVFTGNGKSAAPTQRHSIPLGPQSAPTAPSSSTESTEVKANKKTEKSPPPNAPVDVAAQTAKIQARDKSLKQAMVAVKEWENELNPSIRVNTTRGKPTFEIEIKNGDLFYIGSGYYITEASYLAMSGYDTPVDWWYDRRTEKAFPVALKLPRFTAGAEKTSDVTESSDPAAKAEPDGHREASTGYVGRAFLITKNSEWLFERRDYTEGEPWHEYGEIVKDGSTFVTSAIGGKIDQADFATKPGPADTSIRHGVLREVTEETGTPCGPLRLYCVAPVKFNNSYRPIFYYIAQTDAEPRNYYSASGKLRQIISVKSPSAALLGPLTGKLRAAFD